MQIVESIDIQALPFTPDLIKDFLRNESKLADFISVEPTIEDLEKAISHKKKSPLNRKLLVDVLKKQYATIEPNDAVQVNIDLLLDENTFTFTAAHQPCLMLGPVYNLVKISAAIVAALEAKKRYPTYNFVPIFWLGSEDHDKEELCNTNIGLENILWETTDEGAIGEFTNKGLIEVLQVFKEKTHVEAHPLFDFITKEISHTKDFGQLTQALVHHLFKQFGLVVLDQNEEAFKQSFSRIITDELKHSRAESVLQTSNAWFEENYHAQLSPRPINFFKLGNQSRIRIERDSYGNYLCADQKIAESSSIDSLIEYSPAIFSPNVVFRPLMQEWILPNLCFIGGAGELSYWLQLKPLFDYYAIPYPMLAHRPMAAFLPVSALEKIKKLNLSVPSFLEDEHDLIKTWLKEHASIDLDTTNEKNSLQAIFDVIIAKAIQIDKSLEGAVKGELQKTFNGIDNLQAKMIKAEKRNQETSVNQIQQIKKMLYPNGVLWERSENSLAFLLRLSDKDFRDFVLLQNPFDQKLNVLS